MGSQSVKALREDSCHLELLVNCKLIFTIKRFSKFLLNDRFQGDIGRASNELLLLSVLPEGGVLDFDVIVEYATRVVSPRPFALLLFLLSFAIHFTFIFQLKFFVLG